MPTRIAVVGAGLIGRRHAAIIAGHDHAELAAIADPDPAGREVARSLGVKWFPGMEEMIEAARPDGVVIATPNQLHVANGLSAVRAGVPALIEKPIADQVQHAIELITVAEDLDIALLVGHHRRHNPLIQRAKAIIESGDLGQVVTAHGFFWLLKPDEYFQADWRRRPGAGPILLNLIHDVDLLRYLCGEIDSVSAIDSKAVRAYEVEDTVVANLRFSSGALGTISASDTVTAPWSWEQTAGENPAYPHTDQSCYLIGGTHGSLALPQGEVWSYPAGRGWWEPLERHRIHIAPQDPLVRQIDHFCRVIDGSEEPLVSGRDALQSLKVLEALRESAHLGREIAVE